MIKIVITVHTRTHCPLQAIEYSYSIHNNYTYSVSGHVTLVSSDRVQASVLFEVGCMVPGIMVY